MHKCIRRCTFMGRYWEKDQVCDFGKVTPPHHFIATDEEANTALPKPRIDIHAAVPKGVNVKSFYEMAKNRLNTNVGFASTLEKDEIIHDPKQLKRK